MFLRAIKSNILIALNFLFYVYIIHYLSEISLNISILSFDAYFASSGQLWTSVIALNITNISSKRGEYF